MAVLTKSLFLIGTLVLVTGCQMGYLLRSAGGQISLLNRRVPLEQALQDPTLNEEQQRKLKLAVKAKAFAEQELGLAVTKNYTSYVKLDRPYVTWAVSAAPKWQLNHYLWHFPIVGSVPYKGFFAEDQAKEEDAELKKQDLDTYVRGVSAYSTLGYFRDPILSSMLNYKDRDLVNTIIHETVHATLFIKNSADFNERLATFMGDRGAEAFFQHEEGASSWTATLIHNENLDGKRFSDFITAELKSLEDWYKAIPPGNRPSEQDRHKRLREIQVRFAKEVKPQLITRLYRGFEELELNNARLLVYKTYVGDMSDLEAVFNTLGGDYKAFLALVKSLERVEHPEEKIKEWSTKSRAELLAEHTST